MTNTLSSACWAMGDSASEGRARGLEACCRVTRPGLTQGTDGMEGEPGTPRGAARPCRLREDYARRTEIRVVTVRAPVRIAR